MTYSLTNLRKNLFKVVDEIIRTGRPVDIEREGHHLKLVLDEPKSKLANIKPHPDVLVDDAESYVHEDWSQYWNKDDN